MVDRILPELTFRAVRGIATGGGSFLEPKDGDAEEIKGDKADSDVSDGKRITGSVSPVSLDRGVRAS